MMLSKSFPKTIAVKCVNTVDRSFCLLLLDMVRQFISRYRFNNLGVNAYISLQKDINNAFRCCTTSLFTLIATTQKGLVKFDFSSELCGLQFGNVINRLSKFLKDSGDRFIIHSKVTCQMVRRLLLIKTKNYFQHSAKNLGTFILNLLLI